MGRNPNASWGLSPKPKARCLCGVTPQPNKAASVPISLFVMISEAHLCYEKKTQSGVDRAGGVCAFQSGKGSRAPWRAPITGADLPCRHVRNITRQTASISGKELLLVSRLWLVGGGIIKTQQPYVDTVLPLSIWEYLHVFFVVQTSKWRRSIWVEFMTHFSKFAGGTLNVL